MTAPVRRPEAGGGEVRNSSRHVGGISRKEWVLEAEGLGEGGRGEGGSKGKREVRGGEEERGGRGRGRRGQEAPPSA